MTACLFSTGSFAESGLDEGGAMLGEAVGRVTDGAVGAATGTVEGAATGASEGTAVGATKTGMPVIGGTVGAVEDDVKSFAEGMGSAR